jgi:hypothetical protein
MSKNKGKDSKLETLLGKDTIAELEALDGPALNKRIAEANEAMSECKVQLEADPVYQDIKESMKAVSGAYRDLCKRQRGIIEVCLQLRK